MRDFTVVNRSDVDDSVSGQAPGIEARFARKQLESRDLGVSHSRYAANLHSLIAHHHLWQQEACLVVAGLGVRS